MGLCAPAWCFEKKGWKVGVHFIPNWTPDEVKLKKKEDKMLDDNQNKVVVDQLTNKKNELERKLASFTEQSANVGKKLHDTLFELENVCDVLDTINGKKDEYEE